MKLCKILTNLYPVEKANTLMCRAKDDLDVDESNIIDSKTRGAKPSGTYVEPGDDEGLPGPDDGTSAVAKGGTKS